MDMTYKRHQTETLYLHNLTITDVSKSNESSLYIVARSKNGGQMTLKLDRSDVDRLLKDIGDYYE